MPLVRLPTAPLVAVYGAIPGLANKVCTLAIFMIFLKAGPGLLFFKTGPGF